MATDYEAARSELIAIYRLEFYKNKKNWKLCKDRKPPPLSQTPKHKSTFNETYDVHLHEDLEPEPLLNEAFLNVPPVDELYPEPYHAPYHEHLHIPPAQGTDLGQDGWSGHQWIDPGVEEQQEWCGAEAEAPHEDAPHHHGATHTQRLWPPEEQFPSWSGPQPAELLALAEQWLRPAAGGEGHDAQSDSDSVEFARGAQLAPHSSEIDLSMTNHECSCGCDAGGGGLRALGGGRLLRALRGHARALAQLLRELDLRRAAGEHGQRDNTYPTSPYNPNLYEERPTRDTDPPYTHDRLLAASRLPTPTPTPSPDIEIFPPDMCSPSAGRGRGRGRRLIGLDCGRPYRL